MGNTKKSGKRRVKGTGSIFWSPARAKWIGRVVVGRTRNGRMKYIQRSADTVAELQELLRQD